MGILFLHNKKKLIKNKQQHAHVSAEETHAWKILLENNTHNNYMTQLEKCILEHEKI